MKYRIIHSLFVLFILLPLSAQDTIVIRKSGSGDTAFDLTGFQTSGPAAAEFFRTFRHNLTLPAYFRVGPPSTADFRISGSAAAEGNRLSVTLRILERGAGGQRFGKRYTVKADQGDTLARTLADEITRELRGHDGIAGKRIVLVGERAGVKGKEIYSVYPDGGGLIQLTRDGSVKLGPTWAPDGDSLLYTSYHRGFPDVYRHQLRPPRRTVVSSASGMNAGGDISPDGRYVALVLSKHGRPELYVQHLKSGRVTRLTRTPNSAKSSPSWSPDGQRIVFSSGHEGRPHLYVVDRNGGALKRITRGGGENISADWGENGLIAFTRRRGGEYHVAVLDPRTGESRFVSPPGADYEDPSWAPDGFHIVASRTIQGRSSLSLLDREGKSSENIYSGQGRWYSPDWSP